MPLVGAAFTVMVNGPIERTPPRPSLTLMTMLENVPAVVGVPEEAGPSLS